MTSMKLFCTVTTQSNSNSSTSRSKIENFVVITDGHDGGDVKNSQSTTTPGTGVYASLSHALTVLKVFLAKCTVLQVLLYLKSLTHNLNCQICRQVLKINLIDQIF